MTNPAHSPLSGFKLAAVLLSVLPVCELPVDEAVVALSSGTVLVPPVPVATRAVSAEEGDPVAVVVMVDTTLPVLHEPQVPV